MIGTNVMLQVVHVKMNRGHGLMIWLACLDNLGDPFSQSTLAS
jgi:hypothetical protein